MANVKNYGVSVRDKLKNLIGDGTNDRVCGVVRLRRRLAGTEVSSADGAEMGLTALLASRLERPSDCICDRK